MTDSTEFELNKPPIFVQRWQNDDYDSRTADSGPLILDNSTSLE
jgi:hypothetical protein